MIGVSDCVAPVNSLCAQNIFFLLRADPIDQGAFAPFVVWEHLVNMLAGSGLVKCWVHSRESP